MNALDVLKARRDTLAPKSPTWVGQCGKCATWFEWPEQSGTRPCTDKDGKSYGCFCPVCRNQRQFVLGVVHFQRDDAELNEDARIKLEFLNELIQEIERVNQIS